MTESPIPWIFWQHQLNDCHRLAQTWDAHILIPININTVSQTLFFSVEGNAWDALKRKVAKTLIFTHHMNPTDTACRCHYRNHCKTLEKLVSISLNDSKRPNHLNLRLKMKLTDTGSFIVKQAIIIDTLKSI